MPHYGGARHLCCIILRELAATISDGTAHLREFLLPCEQVRTAGSPDGVLLNFLDSKYRAAADLGRWDRPALERAADPRGI